MKVRTKLTTVVIIAVVFIWVTALSSGTIFTKIHKDYGLRTQEVFTTRILVSEMEETVLEIDHWVMEYVLYGEEISKESVLLKLEHLEEMRLEYTARMKATEQNEEESQVDSRELLLKIGMLDSVIMEILALKEQGLSNDELLKIDREVVHSASAGVLEELEEYETWHNNEIVRLEEAETEAMSSSSRLLLLVAGLITLISSAIALVITKSIVNPLHALHKGTEIIGLGNLDYKVGTKAKDEIGQLSRAFDHMTENLAMTTTTVDNLNREITMRQQVEHDIGERVKELTCLYGISQLANTPDVRLDEILKGTVDLLPPGWQYPDITYARITINGKEFKTDNYGETEWRQSSDIKVGGEKVGILEVGYLEERAEAYEGPFVEEERHLINGLARMLSDIAERKQVEEALRESEGKLRLMFESMTDGITVTDLNGIVIDANDKTAEMHEFRSKDDVLGKNALELIAPRDHERAMANMQRTLEQGPIRSIEYTLLKADGSEFPGELSASTLKDASGNAVGFIALTRDITERKQTEQKIKASLAEKEMLLKEVHHRVKNNMQVISSLLKLQSRDVKDEKTRVLFDDSQRCIQSMVLVYNKLYQSADLARIDLKDYLNELTDQLVKAYMGTSGRITTKVEGDDVPIGVDLAIPCGLIVNELVTNSLKYAFPNGRGGNIRVSLHETRGGEIELIISDSGVGIPKNLDLATTKTLGLRLVTDLVEQQLSGQIELVSDTGTEIRITFNRNQV